MTAILLPVVLTCWLCALVASPPKPLPSYAVEHRVYARLLGRHQRLIPLTVGLTGTALLAFVLAPTEVNPDLRDLRYADGSCGTQEAPYDLPTCNVLEPGGVWAVEELRPDGTRAMIATMASPPILARATAARGSVVSSPKP